MGRISSFLTAEELAEPYKIDAGSKHAIDVDGAFQWETAYKAAIGGAKFSAGAGKGKGGAGAKGDKGKEKEKEKEKKGTDDKVGEKGEKKARRGLFGRKDKKGPVLPVTATGEKAAEKEKERDEKKDEKPFELADLKFQVPKGAFVAIVGRVGSGKVCALF